MKKILKLIMGLGVLLATGCAKDMTTERYDPSTENPEEAYFKSPTMSHAFPFGTAGSATFDLKIYRLNSNGDVTVGLDYTVQSSLCELGGAELPYEVMFKDGEYEAIIPVTVNNVDKFEMGETYTIKLDIGDRQDFKEFVSNSTMAVNLVSDACLPKAVTRTPADLVTYSSLTISLSLDLQWEQMYILKDPSKLLDYDSLTEDDFKKDASGEFIPMTAVYYSDGFEWEAPAANVEHAIGTSLFRMVNFRLDEDGDFVTVVWSIDTDPANKVGGEYWHCELGLQEFLIEDGTLYYYITDASALKYDTVADYPCYWDGENIFSFQSFLVTPEGSAYGFFDDKLTFSTGEPGDPEPAVDIKYLGPELSSTGIQSYYLSFVPNADVDTYYATILPLNPEINATVKEFTDQDLEQNKTVYVSYYLYYGGIDESNPNYDSYFELYSTVYWANVYYYWYDDVFAEYMEAYEKEVVDEIESYRESVVSGNYELFPVLKLDAANTQGWNLGDSFGTYTAVAYSYDESGKFAGLDYQVFTYNPTADGSAVDCDLEFYPVNSPEDGAFSSNAIGMWLQSTTGDITSVRYAVMTSADFAKAKLSESDKEGLKTYLLTNGAALSASDLSDVNNPSDASGGYETILYVDEPSTAYKLITCITNADTDRIEVTDYETTASPVAVRNISLRMRALDYTSGKKSYFAHTNLVNIFENASGVTGGAYLSARLYTAKDGADSLANASLSKLIATDKSGNVTLKGDVEDLYGFIAEYGTDFTTGGDSDMLNLNDGSQVQNWISTSPNTRILTLCVSTYADGSIAWTGAIGKTEFAPEVQFDQTVEVEGKNIKFLWEAWPEDDIFEIDAIEYALVSTSELTAAGVDLTMLGDEELNNFERRLDEGEDAGVIDAQKANAALVNAVLATNGKVFTGDRALYTVNNGGFSGVFENQSTGDYALIALAYDAYNTKLTVAVVTVE